MPDPAPAHPTPDQLDAFAVGRVTDKELARLAAHLAGCPECCARLDHRGASDAILSDLRLAVRDQAGENPPARAPAVRALREGVLRARAAQAQSADLQGATTLVVAKSDTTPPARPADELPRPARVGGYEILEEVGRGGMGVVYLAWHDGLNRPAAVKMVLAGRLADQSDRLRLRLEAELAARVRHPNVVQVYDVGEHEGCPYLAMEWVAGGTLAECLDNRPWAADDAARLVRTLAAAVQAAHDEGVVHRDLKPANILLTVAECGARSAEVTTDDPGLHSALRAPHSALIPKVADFGLARPAHGSGLTRTGFVGGTPEYMAPELVRQGAAVGPAVDVYSLGVILYRLLTGRVPFQAGSALEVLAAAADREPTRPRRLNRAVPLDLEAVCLKCLEKKPHQRYETARDLADDLGRFVDRKAVVARRVGVFTRVTRWCRRNPGTAALLAALAAVFAAGFGLVTWKWLEADGLRLVAEDRRTDAETQSRVADNRRQEAQLNLYRSNVRLANQAIDNGQHYLAQELLEEAVKERKPGDEDLRGFEWYFLHRLLNPVSRLVANNPGGAAYAAVSGDARLVACSCGDGVVRVTEVTDTGDGREVLTFKATLNTPVAFSADGGRFATALGHDVHVWDTRTWERIRQFQSGLPFHLALRPDGRRIATARPDGQVEIWDVDTGRRVRSLNARGTFVDPDTGRERAIDVGGPTRGLAYSPDGRLLAIAGKDGVLRICDAQTGALQTACVVGAGPTYPMMEGQRQPVAFSPDGRTVVTVRPDQHLLLVEVKTGRPEGLIQSGPEPVYGLGFSPGGGTLVTADGKGTARVWEVATGRLRMTIWGLLSPGRAVGVTPDGRVITVASDQYKTIVLWEPAGSAEWVPLGSAGADLSAVAFSPDGRRVATGTVAGPVRVLETDTGRELFTVPGHARRTTGVAFTPDGARLVTVGHDGVGRVWDAADGRKLLELTGHTAPLLGVAVSSDGGRLATCGADGTVRIWDAGTGRPVRTLTAGKEFVSCVAFSPDGRHLAAGSADGPVRVWEVDSGVLVATVSMRAMAVAYRPGGRQIAVSRHDPDAVFRHDRILIEVYDLVDGRPVEKPACILRGHTFVVTDLGYSPDGRRIASVGSDGTLRIWDADGRPLGRELLSLAPGTLERPSRLAFSPDGQRIATTDAGTVRLWEASFPLPPEALIRGRLTK